MSRRNKLIWVLVGCWLAVGLVSVTQADFDDGLAAYERGDYDTALWEWKPLAEEGNVGAQTMLGVMYEGGLGVLQNYQEAVMWYRKAAKQGNARAQTNLGVMYKYGQGVRPDFKQTVEWYRMAAEQGYAAAQSKLGTMYYGNLGVPQDYVLAHMWWSIAAAQGYKNAIKDRDYVAERMTPDQIAEAQKLVREWKPKN